MDTSSTTVFTGKKVNKVRWKPCVLEEPKIFISGSWDNLVNQLNVWLHNPNNDSISNVAKYDVHSDINEIQFVGSNEFVTALDNGDVELFSIDEDTSELKSQFKWNQMHQFSNYEACPCTCLDINEQNIVTAGEDGYVNFLSLNSDKPIYKKGNADSSSIMTIRFTKHSEVITGNVLGQMNLLDLRSSESGLMFRINDSENIAATAITRNPAHTHIVLIGSETGTISVWDLRQISGEVDILDAHSGPVTEMKFHSKYPQQLFTSSMSGELWHWHPKKATNVGNSGPATSFLQKSLLSFEDNTKFWFMDRNSFDKVEVNPLIAQLHLPINSLDVSKNKLVTAADNEAVYLIKNLPLMFT